MPFFLQELILYISAEMYRLTDWLLICILLFSKVNLETILLVFVLGLFVCAGYLSLCWMTFFLYILSCNLETTSKWRKGISFNFLPSPVSASLRMDQRVSQPFLWVVTAKRRRLRPQQLEPQRIAIYTKTVVTSRDGSYACSVVLND